MESTDISDTLNSLGTFFGTIGTSVTQGLAAANAPRPIVPPTTIPAGSVQIGGSVGGLNLNVNTLLMLGIALVAVVFGFRYLGKR